MGIALSLLILVLILFGGAIFYASQKINPQEVRKISLKILKEQFPGADVQLGEIDYSLGTSIRLTIADLSLKTLLKHNEKEDLLALKNIGIKIPLWAILTGGGTVQVDLESPEAFYRQHSDKSNNWSMAMGGGATKAQPKVGSISDKKVVGKKSEESQVAEMAIPAFLLRSKINFSFRKIKLSYHLLSKQKGDVLVDRFLIKDLNLEKSTAFELSSAINLEDQGAMASFKVLAIGQIHLEQFIKSKILKTNVLLKISDVSHPLLPVKLPTFKNNIYVELGPQGNIISNFDFDLGSLLEGKGKVSLDQGAVSLTDFKLTVPLKQNIDLFRDLIGDSASMVQAGDSLFSVSGKLNIDKKGTIIPQFDFSTSPALSVNLKNSLSSQLALRGELTNNNFNFEINGKALDGVWSVLGKTDFNLNKPVIHPVNIDMSLTNMNINRQLVQTLLYPLKKEEEKSEKSEALAANDPEVLAKKKQEKEILKKQKAPSFPPVNLSLQWANLKLSEQSFSGKTAIKVSGSEVAMKKMTFDLGKGSSSISFWASLLDQGALTSKFSVDLAQIPMDAFNAFLPPQLEGVKGTFSGEIKGKAGLIPVKDEMSHDISVNVNAKNGELKGINLKEHILALVDSIDVLKKQVDKKEVKISDEFETLEIKARLRENHYQLNNLYFVGIKNALIAKGSGNIYPLSKTKEGIVDVSLQDKTGIVGKQIEEFAGLKTIPIRLKGIELALSPDIAYTSKIVLAAAAKAQGKKALKKAVKSEKAKKLLDKLPGKIKENKKVKDLLKGIF